MVRFYCDRCNGEVEGVDDLIEVMVESHERPSSSAWSLRSEMCRPCFDGLKEGITNLFGSAEDSKRKSVRRAGS